MQYSWTCTRLTMPWKGQGAWISWRDMAWVPGTSASSPVAWEGGYYGEHFRGEIGVTQGNPLSPTIFNMVAEAVVCHW